MLAQFYNDVNSEGKKIEIIYCSCDNAITEFEDYTNTMPWKTLAFKVPKIDELSTHFNVSGIPRLVIVNKDFKTIVDNARGDVQSKGPKAFDDWLAKNH